MSLGCSHRWMSQPWQGAEAQEAGGRSVSGARVSPSCQVAGDLQASPGSGEDVSIPDVGGVAFSGKQ